MSYNEKYSQKSKKNNKKDRNKKHEKPWKIKQNTWLYIKYVLI